MAIGKMVPKDLSDGRVAETFNLSKKKKKERKKERKRKNAISAKCNRTKPKKISSGASLVAQW